jgi:hypothetical protein
VLGEEIGMSEAQRDVHGWILLALGIGLIANALWMLAGPMHWYEELPAAVPDTGPFNPHFVRDIGCAFLAVGIALVWSARAARERRALAAVALLFLGFHALLHVYDTAVGNLPSDHWWLDFAGVYLPLIVLGTVWLRLPQD